MKRKILILGAGFGGLEAATGLAAKLGDGYEITLVDKADGFSIGFSKIDVLFGRQSVDEVRFRYTDLRSGVRFLGQTVVAIDTDRQLVRTDAEELGYDYLIVALGADLAPEKTPGFAESGAHQFYSMDGAVQLAPLLGEFSSGTLVLGILGAPYKCPPAPFEVACQMHEAFVARGVRDKIDLKVIVPGERAVPSPAVADALERLLAERNIEMVANAAISAVDPAQKKVVTASGDVAYDLFVGVPVHVPPAAIATAGLTSEGFIPVAAANLETRVANVYAVGDITKIPAGQTAVAKAGAFAEQGAMTVVADILRKEGVDVPAVPFVAEGACYFEFGHDVVGKIEANFLGGEKPRMAFEGPDPGFAQEKKHFLESRRDRWFGS